MKATTRQKNPEELRRQYPLDLHVSGWRFRVEETSAGAFHVEGADRFGRVVTRRGEDSDTLLNQCKHDALDVHRRLTEFVDSEEFYACADVLCLDLVTAGFSEFAERIRDAMRAGSTGGEILGAMRREMIDIRSAPLNSDGALRSRIGVFIATIDQALGGRWRG
jgi:hypothetical protein